MNKKEEILFMQVRLIRLAKEQWKIPLEKILNIFKIADVLTYIENCYGIFHCEGDEAVLEDINHYLKIKGINAHD